jgi:hypothetical protein
MLIENHDPQIQPQTHGWFDEPSEPSKTTPNPIRSRVFELHQVVVIEVDNHWVVGHPSLAHLTRDWVLARHPLY